MASDLRMCTCFCLCLCVMCYVKSCLFVHLGLHFLIERMRWVRFFGSVLKINIVYAGHVAFLLLFSFPASSLMVNRFFGFRSFGSYLALSSSLILGGILYRRYAYFQLPIHPSIHLSPILKLPIHNPLPPYPSLLLYTTPLIPN